MRWLLLCVALVLSVAETGLAIDAPRAEQIVENGHDGEESESNLCASFSESESRMNQAWSLLRERLSEEAYAALKREQTVWLQERPARAKELARKNVLSQCQAYALVNRERLEHFERLLPRAQKPSLSGESQDFKIIPRGKPEPLTAPGLKIRYLATVQGYVGYAELRGLGYYAFFDRGAEKCFVASVAGADKKLLAFLKNAAEKKRIVEITGRVDEYENGGCSVDVDKKVTYSAK